MQRKNGNMKLLDSYDLDKRQLLSFAKKINRIAKENGMTVGSCAESIDLHECGIEHNCCIDKALIENIIDCRLRVEKDKNQRQECGYMESVEIGTYDPKSPMLCGALAENDKITERKMKSLIEQQLSFEEVKLLKILLM